MAQHHQQQPQHGAYPPLSPSYPAAAQGPYVITPPPMGYPVKDSPQYPSHTQSRGGSHGFLRGCLAALCCCWILDVCVC